MFESSWYRWICNLWKEIESIGPQLQIQHVRAHVDIQTASTYELLNHRADQVANKVGKLRTLNYSEWPTFEMQKYTAWKPSDNSYIETDLYRWTILA
jgi:hypothetical protein